MELLVAVQETNPSENQEVMLLPYMNTLEKIYSSFEEELSIGVEKALRTELAGKLYFPLPMEGNKVDIEDDCRKLLFKGDLTIIADPLSFGSNRSILAYLFDDYLLLSTPVQRKYAEDVDEVEILFKVIVMVWILTFLPTYYKLTSAQIPMSLLVLHIYKEIDQFTVGNSIPSLLYPFRVRHVGQKDIHTLYASGVKSLNTWCTQIMAAAKAYASNDKLQSSRSEALFSLHVLAWSTSRELETRTVTIGALALDTTIRACGSEPRMDFIIRDISSATMFYGSVLRYVAIGCKDGFCVGEVGNFGRWHRFVPLRNVDQISVIEKSNIFVALASSALWVYRADAAWKYLRLEKGEPQRTEVATDVKFFVTSRMKDRSLLVYAESFHTVFKVRAL